jgi:hypothetical protein
MECEASDASKALDRANEGLAKLSKEFKGLQFKHTGLQESYVAL